ncbi:hypothetical protein B0T18DRAFT_400578 [Schizothecium vesticola]|uniref:Fe2OG dioxygenase domain-containing protein n=1 Tax=Schizothecium vesticola TaxID=314040 RepID=A0AA40FC82_9PEZI|nr:hypothetical protein B0T18DRAFT_400578 [Schizothecium vesticola]
MNEPLPPAIDPANPSIHRWPDLGLTLIHDFITPAEEAVMIAAFHAVTPETTIKKRISQHYGHHFDYTTFGVTSRPTPLPEYISSFLPRLPLFPDRISTGATSDPPCPITPDDGDVLPDQFTVQYYPPGAGIPPHVDTHSMFSEALYSLSYGSAVPMMFRQAGQNEARKLRLPKRSLGGGGTEAPVAAATTAPEHPSWELLLPARSLLVMTGASRYGYVHGIKGRKTDMVGGEAVARQGRYSITMRSVRRGERVGCECAFPGVCDARVREEEEAAEGR